MSDSSEVKMASDIIKETSFEEKDHATDKVRSRFGIGFEMS